MLAYLDTSNTELLEGPFHLGAGFVMGLGVGDDFDEQRIIVWGDVGSRKGGGTIQTDTHTLTATEYLQYFFICIH